MYDFKFLERFYVEILIEQLKKIDNEKKLILQECLLDSF